MWKLQPSLKKVTPLFPSNPPLNVEVPLFENLVGGSTPPAPPPPLPPHLQKREGVHTMALFCGNYGKLHRNITHDPNGSLDSLIKYYFSKEMAYQIVVHVLDACHDIQISLRTLKRKLKTMKLTKSPNITDEVLRQIIKRELLGPSAGHGYRFMWCKLKAAYGVQVRRSTVMEILRQEDTAGTLLGKSRYIKRRVGMHTVMTNSNHMSFLYMVA